jgi:hypothetical protein
MGDAVAAMGTLSFTLPWRREDRLTHMKPTGRREAPPDDKLREM